MHSSAAAVHPSLLHSKLASTRMPRHSYLFADLVCISSFNSNLLVAHVVHAKCKVLLIRRHAAEIRHPASYTSPCNSVKPALESTTPSSSHTGASDHYRKVVIVAPRHDHPRARGLSAAFSPCHPLPPSSWYDRRCSQTTLRRILTLERRVSQSRSLGADHSASWLWPRARRSSCIDERQRYRTRFAVWSCREQSP